MESHLSEKNAWSYLPKDSTESLCRYINSMESCQQFDDEGTVVAKKNRPPQTVQP